MTSISGTRAIDMFAFDLNGINTGVVSTHTATKFIVTSPGGTVFTFTGTGLGAYDANNVPHAGSFTKLIVTDAQGAITVTGFTITVTQFFGYVHTNDLEHLYQALLSGVDSLTGTVFNDSLLGYGDNDKFFLGAGGNDFARGDGGNDTFNMGGALANGDVLDGGAGSDTVVLDGDYSVVHQLANNTLTSIEKIVFTTGHTYNLRLSDGNIAAGQTLVADGSGLGAGDQLLFRAVQETDGAVNVTGGAGNDDLRGGAGADKLTGGDGNDALRGGAGNDKLIAGNGDDYLNGGAGKDQFDGGAGNDRVSFFDVAATQAVLADLRTGVITNDGFGNKETMVSIESLGAGTVFADKLYGNDSANFMLADTADIIKSFGGDDHFQVGGAAAVIDGGDGVDGIDLFTASRFVNLGAGAYTQYSYAGVYVNLSTNMIVNDSFGGSGHVYNIENLNGSYYNDILVGNNGDNVMGGLTGDDFIRGMAGNDTIDGGDGNDQLRGELGNDTISGGNGDDLMRGGAGVDSFDGGAGNDRVGFFETSATQAVIADLRTQTISNDGFGNVEHMTSIEGLGAGTVFADKFYGDDNANVILGDTGDTIMGFGGNDSFQLGGAPVVLDGGAGIDGISLFTASQLVATPGGATLVYSGGVGVYVNLAANMIYNDGFGHTGHVYNIENVNGSYYNDILVGTNGDNVMGGLTGNDQLYGLNGNDTLNGDEGADFLIGGNGNDIVNGGADNDQLRGNGGNDTLSGGTGDDLMRGGTGVDSFDGGDGNDRVSFFEVAATQAVVADLRTQTISNDGFGKAETMTSIESLGAGTRFADTFYGDDGANLILGDTADTIATFAGDDVFQIGGAPGSIDGGDGVDTILGFTRQTFVDTNADGIADEVDSTGGVIVNLAVGQIVDDSFGHSGTLAGIENVGGSLGADMLTGDAGANTLLGDAGNDVIEGGDGNDMLSGDGAFANSADGIGFPSIAVVADGAGDDVLMGGHGDDTLDGGDGNDTASYADMEAGVTVNLATQGSAQDTGVGGMDTLISIENLVGSGSNDTLKGNGGNNVIDGGAGNDNISIDSGGDDIALGGDGGDTFIVGGQLNNNDHIDGGSSPGEVPNGSGPVDVIVFYGPAQTLNLAPNSVQNVESLYFYPGFLPAGHWTVGTADAIIAAGHSMFFNAVDVTQSNVSFTFDASLETDGNAYLLGGAGDDTLIGGQYYSILYGALGNDTLTGHGGLTYASYLDRALGTGVTVSLALNGIAQDTGGQGIDTLTDIENLVGSQNNDTLTGSAVANIIVSAGGNDTIGAGDGNDRIELSAGNNIVDGGNGTDIASWNGTVYGYPGPNFINLTGGVTVSLMTVGSQDTGQGTVTLTNIENLEGSKYGDTLTGDNTANTIYGEAGDDTLLGNNGNDVLYGDRGIVWTNPNSTFDGTGADTISGGKGNDYILGGGGADKLTGGLDADTFAYETVSDSNDTATDRITDFASGSDHIQLWFLVGAIDGPVTTDKLTHLGTAADAAHLGGHDALLANVGGTTYLVVDADGVAGYQAGADLLIRMDGVASITTGDFTAIG